MKIPRSLGRYEVVDLIGQGGMGALFRARDPRIGRYVAIKLLRRDFDTPELRDRFSREARAAGCLSHPNIVTIYDVGEDDGLPFIAMEYVRGETFVDLVGLRPPLPVPRKLQLIEEVCAGLAHAHESGIVHRDIKPANLIVGGEGTVKILDFGIAKLTASEITRRGAIMGTLNYMSPEQVTATAVDGRADIFSVGAVLYELLSHQQAFPGNMPVEVLNRIVHGVPTPIDEYWPEIDPRLARVVERALEKDPARRFQNVSALQDELAEIRQNPMPAEPRHAPPTTTPGGTEVISILPATPLPRKKTPRPSSDDLTQLRVRQVEAHLAEAAAAYDAGDYDAGIESCRQVLLLDGSEERAIAQLDRIHAAIDQQQDQRLAVEEAQRLEEARIHEAVDDARRRFNDGQHQSAIESLEALPASHALVASTLEELTAALQEIEEQRLLQDRLERTLREFDTELARDDLSRARALLKTAVALAAGDSRVQTARRRLDQAVAAVAAKEAAEARHREAGQKLAEVAAHLEAGDLDEAAVLLKAAVDLAPQHPEAAPLSERLRHATEERAAAERAERIRAKVVELVQSATQRLATPEGDRARQLAEALREVNEALALDSQAAEAQGLKTVVEAAIAEQRHAARVKAVISNARARFANGKHQAAIRLLEGFAPAGDPQIGAALEELRAGLRQIEEERRIEQERLARQGRVAALVADAGTALREQRIDTALSLIAKATEIDPATPELAQLTEQARAQQAAAQQSKEIDKLVAELDARLAADDVESANVALSAASALSSSDPRVSQARERIESAIVAREAADARARDLDEKNAAAEELLDRGDLDGAQRLLNLAAAIDVQHPRTVSLTERLQAARVEKEAADAAEHLRQTVDELIAGASEDLQNAEQHAHSVLQAMQKIGRALALAPDHPEAQALKVKADERYAAQRQEAFVQAAIRNARSRFAMGKHQAAFKLLEGLDPAANPIVADTLNELRATHERDRVAAEQAAAAREANRSRQLDPSLAETRAVVLRPPRDERDATKVIPASAETGRSGAAVRRPPRGLMLAAALLLLAALLGLLLILGRAGLNG